MPHSIPSSLPRAAGRGRGGEAGVAKSTGCSCFLSRSIDLPECSKDKMSFLNATLILGFVAAALPIVLHLIARRQPQRQVFPAIRFLANRVDVNRSRLRIRRWLLLAFRAGLIGMIAMALAQPYVDQAVFGQWLTLAILAATGVGLLALAAWATLQKATTRLVQGLLLTGVALLLLSFFWGATLWASGDRVSVSETAPAAVAIVIDNSPRSGFELSERTSIEIMRQEALWLLSRYPRDSRISILDRSARPAAFSLDANAAMRLIERAEPLETTIPLPDRIAAAVRLVRSSDLERRAVFVLTDLTEESWIPSDAPDAGLGLPPLLAEPPGVNLQVINIGLDQQISQQRRNRRLGLPRIADPSPPRETPVPISIDVLAQPEPGEELSLTCELKLYQSSPSLPAVRDGETVLPDLQLVDRATVVATGDQAAELLLTLPPLAPGMHHGRIELVDSDPLRIDDVRYFSVFVRSPIRLLIVSDDDAASDHVSRVLNAEFSSSDPRAPFQIERIILRQFNSDDLSDFDIVAILDPAVEQIHDEVCDDIVDWLGQGGSLFVGLGGAARGRSLPSTSDVAAQQTNRKILFPLRRVWREPEPGSFLEWTQPTHPILSPLSTLPGGVPWSPFRVWRYWQLALEPTDNLLMRYAGSQNPALVERAVGDGKLVLLSTPIVPSSRHPLAGWNELSSAADAWPAFLLLRQIFDYLSDREGNQFNILTGQPASLSLPEQPGVTNRMQLFTADAPPVPVDVENNRVTVGTVPVSGNYWLRGSSEMIGFSVNLAESATDMRLLDPELLDEILGAAQYDLVSDRQSILAAEERSAAARPLYAQIMLLVLILFAFEQLLASRFYGAASKAVGVNPASVSMGVR